ncbi:MAG: FAD-dependent oxidoreductase [Acidobacteria bacterium]|nr:MAG: FAD-dependent oxidoreductase [Acidobacteriota bacterium]
MPFSRQEYDAVVIGSGPNGLSAGITIAEAGRAVLLIEGQETIGGGVRSAELTLPGFLHDVCSSVYPMAVWSPFFRRLPLAQYGLEWVHPVAPLAHPLDDGSTVILERSLEQTAQNLGADAGRYVRLMGPLLSAWPRLESSVQSPFSIPAHPLAAMRFGFSVLRSASSVAKHAFRGERARALVAGLAAHAVLPLERVPSAAFGLVLGIIAHTQGWPFARGGSQNIAHALAKHLASLGGEIVTGMPVASLEQLPRARAFLCDITPRQLLTIAGSRVPAGFRGKLESYQYGPGVCKLDWALDGPIPWKARECGRAGTVHLGGTFAEIAYSERDAWCGRHSERPFVLLAQPTLFDSTRAPAGKHTAWAYCHVPNGSTLDMTDAIEKQIERFAPGFRRRILKRSVRVAASLEGYNPNLIGGDIGGGVADLRQFLLRPTRQFYRTPAKGIYLCSSSTPPGPGVHGLCGHLAARAALKDLF